MRGDLAREIDLLKRTEGKSVLAHGGGTFAQRLTELGLIDEYRLVVHPVALGSGLPLFSAIGGPVTLAFVSSTSFAAGAVANVYRRM